MIIYGVALLSICTLTGLFIGDLLGQLMGVPANVGGVGIAMRKGENELRSKVNAALKAIKANGTYKAINARYFDFDISGAQ